MPYIIEGEGALIYGAGDTPDAAWANAVESLAIAQITVVADDAGPDADGDPPSFRRCHVICVEASEALASAVLDGSWRMWTVRDGIAMTMDEADAVLAPP